MFRRLSTNQLIDVANSKCSSIHRLSLPSTTPSWMGSASVSCDMSSPLYPMAPSPFARRVGSKEVS
ncbi:hypothetical protein CY34DRAFT_808345 [Suillus luteus UH-Slu-Lm8-n1]|uniref:Uncharacterized protein n=1 Tax=Suillus luteus UH-Slu-Lm8-n1 TaxID=930992 RepID=A0A0D0AMW7_9AGAM|nr:hypothetical protein CY34DRAFT_808345 [Suillus luteus UH-Slu-Lm8-n1]